MIRESNGPAIPAGRLAVMPFENLTGHRKAVELILPRLSEQLVKRGFKLMPETELRNLVRAHRIRSVGRIGAAAAKILNQEAGIGFIAVGSISIYEEGAIPDLAVTLRLLDAKTMKIIWAGSGAGSGRDRVWLFGLGKSTDVESLADNVLGKMLNTLPACLPDHCTWSESPGSSVAIIPFENFSSDVHAADIVANSLLAKLFALNLEVLEPGLIEDLLARRMISPRGEIDGETMREIKREFGADVIMTGSVDDFELGKGDEFADKPSVELSLKYLRAGSVSLAGLRACDVTGRQRENLFGVGREYSMGNLITRQIGNLLDEPTFMQLAQPEVKK